MNDWEAGTSRGALVTEDFDVFLNHRGPDVKATFVAHLEDALRCAGHRPFLDARSLMKGNPALQSIEQAVAMAKVHVAVVSPGYADSKYCLNELVAMMSSGKPVVPLFYGVEPVDLRWVENGPFADAFQRHKSKGRSEKKVQQWRDSLAALAGITGFRLADYKSDESKLKRDVVDQVARLTPSHICVEVDFCRVGLEGPTSRCIQALEEMGGGIGILGIVGMGGIGKTSLAREIYNYYASHTKFTHMSFLEIHRDEPSSSSNIQIQPTWLSGLRRQLLWDLLRIETRGLTDYSNWFKKVSTLGPIMIVVDDVHNLDQFRVLIPYAADLHPGSRLIVTSRDWSIMKNVVRRAGVDHHIFKVAVLESHDSNVLFNWHAFHSKDAQEDFRDLAKDVAKACGGLPLALKVIGSGLFDKRSKKDRETIWVEAIDAIRRSQDVKNVLRWSYDILPEMDKRMFVDITCLFINRSFAEALSFWSNCKECASCGGMSTPYTALQNLIDKNLVSWFRDTMFFKVHDLLVEMGEEIGKMSRTHLTRGNIGEVALTRKQGFMETKALILRGSKKRKFEVEEFAHMPNLHYLELPDGGVMDGDWRCMSKELRWLRWRNTSLTRVPLELDLSQLTTLDFSRSPTLVTLWSKSECNLKGCPKLVRLDMRECTSIKELPDAIGQCSQLQMLKLGGCSSLRKLPEWVGQLKQLKILDLESCKRLKSLPETLGFASSLWMLVLWDCKRVEWLPDSIGMLKELESLYLGRCANLKTLTDSIGGLSSLEYFYTQDCTSLKRIPHSLQYCTRLICFSLYENPSSDPETFSIGSIENARTNSMALGLDHAHGLASHLDYGAFKLLQFLCLEDKSLFELPESIGLMTALDTLRIQCKMLKCLPNSLGELKKLITLSLARCENLRRLPKTLGRLTNLRRLFIKECGLLKKLPRSIGLLSSLKYFGLFECKKMRKLPTSFTQLKIQSFVLYDCENIDAMEALMTLQGMSIWGTTSVTKLPPSLGVLSNLFIGTNVWLPKPFDGTCHVLKEDESGFLKVYHIESTHLSSLQYHMHAWNCSSWTCPWSKSPPYGLNLLCKSTYTHMIYFNAPPNFG